MRVFVDTNVLVAAIATRAVLASHELVVSDQVLLEMERVLTTKLGVPADVVAEAVEFIREHEVVPSPGGRPQIDVRDPDDVPILAATIEAGVDVLVTGDADLLEVAGESPVPIVTPRELWRRLRAAEAPE